MISARDIYRPDFTFKIIIPQLFSYDLKLSIYPIIQSIWKGLVPYYALPPFYKHIGLDLT